MLKIRVWTVLMAFTASAWISANAVAGPSDQVTLVKDKALVSTIVVGKNSPPAQAYAARELQTYLAKISGAQIVIRELRIAHKYWSARHDGGCQGVRKRINWSELD